MHSVSREEISVICGQIMKKKKRSDPRCPEGSLVGYFGSEVSREEIVGIEEEPGVGRALGGSDVRGPGLCGAVAYEAFDGVCHHAFDAFGGFGSGVFGEEVCRRFWGICVFVGAYRLGAVCPGRLWIWVGHLRVGVPCRW